MSNFQIELRLMTAEEFEAYRAKSLHHYASEKMKAEGLTQADADRVAAEAFQSLLPNGHRTPDQFLYVVLEKVSHSTVGTLWLGKKGTPPHQKAYIYDVELSPSHQGKGYGKQTMLLAEAQARALGLKSIGLHVFGHNTRARALYEKLDYRPTNIVMSKDLT